VPAVYLLLAGEHKAAAPEPVMQPAD